MIICPVDLFYSRYDDWMTNGRVFSVNISILMFLLLIPLLTEHLLLLKETKNASNWIVLKTRIWFK